MDMMNKKCTFCEKGIFIEKYMLDDLAGILHCNVCNELTRRYIPLNQYRDRKIEILLKKI